MAPPTALGQYLRARRELVRPEHVGLHSSGRRRVPGLRREELATLAGISPDYYLRLEQGRDRRPSAQVVDALARALQLDADAAAHLHALSHPAAAPRRRDSRERAPASIERLIASWPTTPAFVHGRHMDVLAANALAVAVSPGFRPGANLMRAVFLDPEVRALCSLPTRPSGVAFSPWHPTTLADRAADAAPLRAALDPICARHDATVAQIAIAWLLRRSPLMLPIPGTSSLEHLEENLAAATIDLAPEDVEAITQLVPEGEAAPQHG